MTITSSMTYATGVVSRALQRVMDAPAAVGRFFGWVCTYRPAEIADYKAEEQADLGAHFDSLLALKKNAVEPNRLESGTVANQGSNNVVRDELVKLSEQLKLAEKSSDKVASFKTLENVYSRLKVVKSDDSNNSVKYLYLDDKKIENVLGYNWDVSAYEFDVYKYKLESYEVNLEKWGGYLNGMVETPQRFAEDVRMSLNEVIASLGNDANGSVADRQKSRPAANQGS